METMLKYEIKVSTTCWMRLRGMSKNANKEIKNKKIAYPNQLSLLQNPSASKMEAAKKNKSISNYPKMNNLQTDPWK